VLEHLVYWQGERAESGARFPNKFHSHSNREGLWDVCHTQTEKVYGTCVMGVCQASKHVQTKKRLQAQALGGGGARARARCWGDMKEEDEDEGGDSVFIDSTWKRRTRMYAEVRARSSSLSAPSSSSSSSSSSSRPGLRVLHRVIQAKYAQGAT